MGKANLVHNLFYDYSKVNYVNSWTKVAIACPEHGEFWQSPNGHLSQKQGCPVCRASKGELEIKSILDKYDIRHEAQFIIPNQIYKFRYDFYLPDHKVLIEFHGRQHYEYIDHFHRDDDGFSLQKQRDVFKKALAKELGYTLVEFNHQQLKELTKEEFTKLVINTIQKYRLICLLKAVHHGKEKG